MIVEKAGGKCLPCVVDIREEAQVEKAVSDAVERFGGIDIVVNNASAIQLTGTVDTPMKRYMCRMCEYVYGVYGHVYNRKALTCIILSYWSLDMT